MKHKPGQFKQNYQQSCLIQCIAFCLDTPITIDQEGEILKQGLLKQNINYTIGCAKAASDYFNKKIEVSYHYKKFATDMNAKSIVKVNHSPVNSRTINSFLVPTPTYIDMASMGSDVHEPHWITIIPMKNKSDYMYFDPAFGEIRQVNKQTLFGAIANLSNHLGYSPAYLKFN